MKFILKTALFVGIAIWAPQVSAGQDSPIDSSLVGDDIVDKAGPFPLDTDASRKLARGFTSQIGPNAGVRLPTSPTTSLRTGRSPRPLQDLNRLSLRRPSPNVPRNPTRPQEPGRTSPAAAPGSIVLSESFGNGNTAGFEFRAGELTNSQPTGSESEESVSGGLAFRFSPTASVVSAGFVREVTLPTGPYTITVSFRLSSTTNDANPTAFLILGSRRGVLGRLSFDGPRSIERSATIQTQNFREGPISFGIGASTTLDVLDRSAVIGMVIEDVLVVSGTNPAPPPTPSPVNPNFRPARPSPPRTIPSAAGIFSPRVTIRPNTPILRPFGPPLVDASFTNDVEGFIFVPGRLASTTVTGTESGMRRGGALNIQLTGPPNFSTISAGFTNDLFVPTGDYDVTFTYRLSVSGPARNVDAMIQFGDLRRVISSGSIPETTQTVRIAVRSSGRLSLTLGFRMGADPDTVATMVVDDVKMVEVA